MTVITKIMLRAMLDGSGAPACSLTLVAANYRAEASLPVPAGITISDNELGLISDKLGVLLLKKELDESLWQVVSDFAKSEKNKKYLTAPIGLLLEMSVVKLLASAMGVEVFQQLANSLGIERQLLAMPTPLVTLLNGGIYGDTNLDFEEYLLIPLTKNKSTFKQKLRDTNEVARKLGVVLATAKYDTDLGLLGGYAPNLVSTVEAFDLIIASINLAGYVPARDFGLGVDIGSANLYNKEEHNYLFRLGHNYFSSGTLASLYAEWLAKYPIFYLEDALAPDDLVAWQELTSELREELVLAGDKLFANDSRVLARGLSAGLANTVVVKLQEYESLQDLVKFVHLAKKRNYQVVMATSDRETNEDFVSDLAVALAADFVKFGAMARGERLAKYNRLLGIAETLENFF